MDVSEKLRAGLSLLSVVPDSVFKALLENCFEVLGGGRGNTPAVTQLYKSKPDLIKEAYAQLLSAIAQFVRTGQTKEDAISILNEVAALAPSRSALFGEMYEKRKPDIQMALVNVGSHAPHVKDVSWKMDYVIKSSNLDRSDGPIFHVALQTEKFEDESKKTDHITFACDLEELQELVYKLKDAVRHCQRIAVER